jgi:hypothetical protein
MDMNQFRLPTQPNLVAQRPRPVPLLVPQPSKPVPRKDTAPIDDPRFPGWASKMSDARLVTDYRPHCAANIPTGKQYATRQAMIHSAEEIMARSRNRHAQRVGAGQPFDSSVVPPSAATVKCTPFECGIVRPHAGGIGVSREEGVPELFGTFAVSHATAAPVESLRTKRYEGGRNTPRGGDGWAYEMIH